MGFDNHQQLAKSKHNRCSAYSHAEVVAEQLQKDCQKEFTLGPFILADVPHVHTSRIGVIPKKHQPGKFRLIVDLSSPTGKSVNDSIEKVCYLSHTRVAILFWTWAGAPYWPKWTSKVSLELSLCNPADRHLLGMEWDGQLFIDATLPFGLRSTPKIFNALADTLEWILRQHGVSFIWHYLDDRLVAGRRSSVECFNNIHTVLRLCEILGIPIAEEKSAGPAMIPAIIGIEVDTDRLGKCLCCPRRS